MQIVFNAAGTARCVYDEVIDLAKLGNLTIQRASHVEPTTEGQWLADLSLVAGPTLGPFSTRSAALLAERDWLQANWLAAQQ